MFMQNLLLITWDNRNRMEMLCITCGASTNKYKCPKCLEAYCSLPCYKEHQKVLCQRTQKTDDKFVEDVRHKEPTLHEPFSTEDTVPRNKLELLKDCKPLGNLLYNLHLRKLLSEIDVAPNAWKAMKAAMQEPLFLEFADECLKIVEPQNALD
ncbi:zinc finger HIT domain-containing protein 3 isoform X1 [Bactrocera neohumeralis]|uniref:zinc finger HIT domain-containing protein 3 isoform X1 n=2 Tax=Bactrocera neohumeralis TaxID=98809 RepID=UPI0021668E12|nr:zinc finger HIT domain-containing protein 3 isoform X1 [Bactrocera neohumeralis]